MTKEGESILKGAKEDTEWIIIAVTLDDELILDVSANVRNIFAGYAYAMDSGIEIPEGMGKGVYLMHNLVIKIVKTMWTLDDEAGFVNVTGDFRLLYEWKIEPGCK